MARLLVAIAALLAFAGGRVAAQAHAVAVQHVQCAEHGLEDTGREAPAKGETISAVATSDTHDTCDLAPALTGGVVAADPPALAVADVPAYAPDRPAEGEPGRTGPPILRFAPKTSPPRA